MKTPKFNQCATCFLKDENCSTLECALFGAQVSNDTDSDSAVELDSVGSVSDSANDDFFTEFFSK